MRYCKVKGRALILQKDNGAITRPILLGHCRRDQNRVNVADAAPLANGAEDYTIGFITPERIVEAAGAHGEFLLGLLEIGGVPTEGLADKIGQSDDCVHGVNLLLMEGLCPLSLVQLYQKLEENTS